MHVVPGDLAETRDKVQKYLWTGRKATDLKNSVVLTPESRLIHAKREQWHKESGQSAWDTTAELAARAAVRSSEGASCKRKGCRYIS